MIEQQGRVTRIKGPVAWVRVGNSSGCPACDAGKGCGAGLFAKLLNRSSVEIRVENTIGAKPGLTVTLGIHESIYLGLVLRLYGLPLVAGLAGAAIGHQVMNLSGIAGGYQDATALAGAILAAGLAFRWSARSLQRKAAGLRLQLTGSPDELDACGI